MTATTGRRRARGARAGVAALLCVAAVGLAACGGDDDGDGVARAAGGTGTATAAGTTTGTTTGAAASREDAALAFARCMREQGVDFPDPEADSEGRLRFRAPAGGRGADDPATREAFEACQGELAGAMPELGAEERTALRDAQLAYARCMRENGVDVPDPSAEGGPGVIVRREEADDPDFQAADDECRPIMQRALESVEGAP